MANSGTSPREAPGGKAAPEKADEEQRVSDARDAHAAAAEVRRAAGGGGGGDAMMGVRAADIEPYTGLRYLSKLFRLMAILLVLLLVAEVVTGFIAQGSLALPTLLGVASKLIVSAALLWASGDLAILLIDIGHDVRATRILMGRSVAHAIAHTPESAAEALRRSSTTTAVAGAPPAKPEARSPSR